jgi:predicted flap endonuclease-1-like 5' DNA nuclease
MNYLLLATLFFAEGGTEPVGVPSWVPIVIGFILLLLFLWGLNRNNIPQGEGAQADDHPSPQLQNEAHTVEVHLASMEAAETVAPTEVVRSTAVPLTESIEADDLKRIEGIGPKIEGILHEAGIYTFAALAITRVAELEKIVREDAGIRIAFPDTWPEQAKLAAAGEWSKLETLQDELKGGRRA